MPRRLLSDVSDQVGWPIGVILQITVPRYPMFFSFKSLPPKKKNQQLCSPVQRYKVATGEFYLSSADRLQG